MKRSWMAVAAVVLAVTLLAGADMLVASDHDDGETDTKGRNVNITDVYAFRECDQSAGASCDNVIVIMNVNPRSLARQQYYFSTNARYEIKVERPANVNAEPTAAGLSTPDTALRFTFGAPDSNRRQAVTVTPVQNGVAGSAIAAGTTTALNDSPIISNISAGGSTLSVFAGLRQDPFFFDVEQFFRVRAGALGSGPAVVFRHPGIDFTWGYNVLSIAVRVPAAFLRQGTSATAFDLWATVSVPNASGGWTQVERLAQPAINEGLLVTNDFLNALNSIGPEVEATLVEGPDGCAGALSNPIIAEAAGTLLALGNTVPQALAICNAFLPDVMRIDVTGASGYAAAVTSIGRPARGRKIMDDVIDITLGVIVPGSNQLLEHDNVSYNLNPPINETGHRPVLPAFPYLPSPN
ncbi:MAG: DUF4331 domain-containing protein [bacterium]